MLQNDFMRNFSKKTILKSRKPFVVCVRDAEAFFFPACSRLKSLPNRNTFATPQQKQRKIFIRDEIHRGLAGHQ